MDLDSPGRWLAGPRSEADGQDHVGAADVRRRTFWCFWENGYQALASLDDDGDGWLTGKELDGLAVWRDTNGNGVSEPGEVKTLSECGIAALRCRADAASPAANCAAQAIQRCCLQRRQH